MTAVAPMYFQQAGPETLEQAYWNAAACVLVIAAVAVCLAVVKWCSKDAGAPQSAPPTMHPVPGKDAAASDTGAKPRRALHVHLGARRRTRSPQKRVLHPAVAWTAVVAATPRAVSDGSNADANEDVGAEAVPLSSTTARVVSPAPPITPSSPSPPTPAYVFVVDYDNTLFPTTYVLDCQEAAAATAAADSPASSNLQPAADFETAPLVLLEAARRLGSVYIVTNSRPGWVQESLGHVYPALARYVTHVPVVYSRTSSALTDAREENLAVWKLRALQELPELQALRDRCQHVEIIVIGDSACDHEAAHLYQDEHKDTTVKSVYIRATKQDQTPHNLAAQLRCVAEALPKLCAKAGNKALMLEVGAGGRVNPAADTTSVCEFTYKPVWCSVN